MHKELSKWACVMVAISWISFMRSRKLCGASNGNLVVYVLVRGMGRSPTAAAELPAACNVCIGSPSGPYGRKQRRRPLSKKMFFFLRGSKPPRFYVM